MSEDNEFHELLVLVVEGVPGARAELHALHNRRALEAADERAAFVEQLGGLDVVPTVLVDGGTTHTPPGFADVNDPMVTMPDGRVLPKDVVRRSKPTGPPDA